MYRVISQAAERLSERGGWKRHVPWLLSSLGEALNIAHAFIYKNYPDKDDQLTAVRLYRWANPVHRAPEHLAEPRVSRYEGRYLSYLRGELTERRSVLCTSRNPLPPLRDYMTQNGIDRVAIIPIFAGSEWWGFIGIEDSLCVPRDAWQLTTSAINDVLRAVATIIGESIRGAGLDQALRWSERLHRVQRDIALTATIGSARRGALDELLTLICELGEFDAGAIDIVTGDEALRIASVGEVPAAGRDGWCHSCRPPHLSSPPEDDAGPVYGDASMLAFCERTCPLRRAGFHSYAVVPIVYRGTAAATLSLLSTRRSIVPGPVRASIEAIVSEIGMIIAVVRAEEDRRRSDTLAGQIEERYALAAEAGRVGVWEYLPQERAFYVDRSFLDLLAMPVETRLVPEETALLQLDLEDRGELLERLRSGPEHWTGDFDREISCRAGDGSRRWLIIRSRAVTTGEGHRRLAGTAVDITHLSRYRETPQV